MKPQFRTNRKTWFITIRRDGTRTTESFRTKAEAEARIKELEEYGRAALSPAERNDYIVSVGIAKNSGWRGTLAEFVSTCVANGTAPVVKSIPIAAAVDEFLSTKERIGRRELTIKDLTTRLRTFVAAFPINTAELTRRDVETYCSSPKWAPRTCKNHFTCVLGFLRWCNDHKLLSFAPEFRPETFLPRQLKKAVGVFSADEIEHFFMFVLKNFRRYVPFYAVQAFAGLRNAEASRLTWDNIDFQRRTITLPAEIVKTGEDFTLRNLPDNLWEWLSSFRSCEWNVPDSYQQWRHHEKFGTWHRNVLRHTFATMHVSRHRNPAETSLILRHRNQQRLWQNYLANPREQSEAERYFSILPPKNP